MKKNVYNIVWADDEIDDILNSFFERDLNNNGIFIVGKARTGDELDKVLSESILVDAVIVDANFSDSSDETNSPRDISGLRRAKYLFLHKYNQKIPFFLFTGRTDELLQDITKDEPDFLKVFPRHEKWFSKTMSGEREDMLNKKRNRKKKNTRVYNK